MAHPTFAFKLWHTLYAQRRQGGFTLLEVLISLIIGSIIVGGLLYLVVEMIQLTRREEVLNQVQLDMQRAIDYINQDAREAVFIYPELDDTSTPISQLSDLPDGEPVLAFWRSDPVDTSALPNDCSTLGAQEDECAVLKIRQTAYTLVVYLQEANADDEIWEGESRIIRYQLPRYANVAALTENTGYIDPVSAESSFANWESDGNTTDGNFAVLVDSVDDPATAGITVPACTSFGNDLVRNPADVTTHNSFFTCVRDNVVEDENAEVAGFNNQDLVVFLRGNAIDDAAIGFGGVSNRSGLPTLQSQVLVRGVTNEQVTD